MHLAENGKLEEVRGGGTLVRVECEQLFQQLHHLRTGLREFSGDLAGEIHRLTSCCDVFKLLFIILKVGKVLVNVGLTQNL